MAIPVCLSFDHWTAPYDGIVQMTPEETQGDATPVIRLAPSLLNADFGRLAEQIALVEEAGVDMWHLDIMDGHFCPNLSFGVPVVAGISEHTDLLLDAHLMIADPGRYAPAFVEAGAGSITFHIETAPQPRDLVRQIRDLGVKVGVALNPDTPAEAIAAIIDEVDIVLVMTVWPGFGGQKLIDRCLEKIELLASQMSDEQWLQVDGGINRETIPAVVEAGADTLVIGSAIFKAEDPRAEMCACREIARRAALDSSEAVS